MIALAFAFASLNIARNRVALAGAAVFATGTALAASGHASAAGPYWFTRTAVFVHAVAVAYWVGAFVPLLAILRRRQANARGIVQTWSLGAVGCVAALVLTGIALVIIQVPSPAGLLGTGYGIVLLCKVTAVVLLLTLAAANRFWLTPRLGKSAGEAEATLRRSVLAELALATLILGIVGLWRFTPPPRAIVAAAPASVATAHIHTDRAMAEVRIRPAGAGPVRVTITVLGGDYRPMEPKEVTATFENRAAGVEGIERRAERVSEGEWEIGRLLLPVAGRWDVRLDLLVSDFEKLALDGQIDIRPEAAHSSDPP
jgi:copper transport protein